MKSPRIESLYKNRQTLYTIMVDQYLFVVNKKTFRGTITHTH